MPHRPPTPLPPWLTLADGEASSLLDVLVWPRPGRPRCLGPQGARLAVQLQDERRPAAQNRAVISVLAQALGLQRVQISVVGGIGSRHKTVRVARLAPTQLLRRLSPVGPSL